MLSGLNRRSPIPLMFLLSLSHGQMLPHQHIATTTILAILLFLMPNDTPTINDKAHCRLIVLLLFLLVLSKQMLAILMILIGFRI